MGRRRLQISNAVTGGSFGDWAFSNATQNPAGESVANHKYIGEFRFKSATGGAQPGLQISVSPDNDRRGCPSSAEGIR